MKVRAAQGSGSLEQAGWKLRGPESRMVVMAILNG